MNNRGFTLIELLVTVILLALVLSIAAYSVTSIIKKTKEENYELLINNIIDACESYYQECKYAYNGGISCTKSGNDYVITLGDLVANGYLKGNNKDNTGSFSIINPLDDVNIATCQVKISNSNGDILVTAVSPSGSCPTSY